MEKEIKEVKTELEKGRRINFRASPYFERIAKRRAKALGKTLSKYIRDLISKDLESKEEH